jgi:membrane-associated protease RseP (regulator of RpoE activity)
VRDPFATVPVQVRHVVLGVAIVVAFAVWLAMVNAALLGAIGVLFFFFVVMIGLHELGHFLMARRAGMKVSEFFIGFGPRLWSVRRGETEYGIKALPLGGYCKIIGMTNLEDVAPDDEPRAFRNASYLGKASTLIAGPASHFILALMLVFAVLAFNGLERPLTTVDLITKDSAAQQIGIKHGDQIESIDGVAVSSWDQLATAIHQRGGKTVAIDLVRDGHQMELTTRLGKLSDGTGFLGVSPSFARQRYSVAAAIYHTPGESWSITKSALGALGKVFSPSGITSYLNNFTSSSKSTSHGTTPAPANNDNNRFVSPVGVTRIAYDASEQGWVEVFSLLISINVFVGLINLVPLIPFDGGHLAVATYEAIATRVRRRRVQVDYAKLMPIAVATISVLAFIFLSSLFLDITKPPPSPF